MTRIDYEITTFYKAILHLFLASGVLPPISPPEGAPERLQPPPWTPPATNILWAVLPPDFELGSNVAILLNTKYNQAPHPTSCHCTRITNKKGH